MLLIEGEFQLNWFLTTVLLSKRDTKVSSVYTWTNDTAEGVYVKMCRNALEGDKDLTGNVEDILMLVVTSQVHVVGKRGLSDIKHRKKELI